MSPPLWLVLNERFGQDSGLVVLTKIRLLMCVKRPLVWKIKAGKAAAMNRGSSLKGKAAAMGRGSSPTGKAAVMSRGSPLVWKIRMTVAQPVAARSQARTGCCCLDQQSAWKM